MTKKNGIIELMRFVFASCVVLFHINGDLWEKSRVILRIFGHKVFFFKCGYIGVEFFFIVSGFLMAKSIYKKVSQDSSEMTFDKASCETFPFILRKIKTLLPYYWPATMFMIIIFIFVDRAKPEFIFHRIPSIFFLQRSGLYTDSFMGASWYISSMLIAMAVIYPFLRRYYYAYTRWFAPVAGCLIIGAMIYLTGNLGGASAWAGITYKANFRAFAEISIGATCFETSRYLKEREFNNIQRGLFSIAALIGYGSAIAYACSNADKAFSGLVFFMLCIAVTISFSEIGIGTGFFQNRFFLLLGSISLPLYLFQNMFRKMVPYIYNDIAPKHQCLIIYSMLFAFSIVFYYIVEIFREKIKD